MKEVETFDDTSKPVPPSLKRVMRDVPPRSIGWRDGVIRRRKTTSIFPQKISDGNRGLDKIVEEGSLQKDSQLPNQMRFLLKTFLNDSIRQPILN